MRLQELPLFSPRINESIFRSCQRKARNNDLEVKDANKDWRSLLAAMLGRSIARQWGQSCEAAHGVSWSNAVCVAQGSSSPVPCSRSLSTVWALGLSSLFRKRKRTSRMSYINMLPLLPRPRQLLFSLRLQHLPSSHGGQDIPGLFHCLLFNTIILATVLAGH